MFSSWKFKKKNLFETILMMFDNFLLKMATAVEVRVHQVQER